MKGGREGREEMEGRKRKEGEGNPINKFMVRAYPLREGQVQAVPRDNNGAPSCGSAISG